MHVRHLGGHGHVQVHAGDGLADGAADLEAPPVEAERTEARLERLAVHAEVEHRREEHVPGDAAHRLEVEQGAHRPLPVRVTLRETSAA